MNLSATEVGVVVINELCQQAVHAFVISPGSRSAPLAMAAAASGRPVHVRIDERTAAFLALGMGRAAAGDPAVVMCSSGTATANYLPAVIEADAAGVPLIVITADRPLDKRDTGANQTIDQHRLYGRAVRWFHELGDGDERYVRGVVAEAVARATGPWPGPVHLNIPLHEPLLDTSPAIAQRVAELTRRSPDAGPPRHPPAANTVGTGHADSWLRGRTGVIVAGEGAIAEPRLFELAERLGMPLLAEPTSGLRTGSALRCGHWLAASEAFVTANQPQVVIQLGRPVLSRPIAALIAGAEDVITCDPLARGWDPGRRTTHRVAQRVEEWAADTPDGDRAFLQRWRDADAVAGEILDHHLDAGEVLSEMGITRDLAAAMPGGSQLVVASSLPIRHLNEVMHPHPGLWVVGNRGASGIDGFMSTAIGVALGAQAVGFRTPVAALAGDLSVIHDLTGLVIGQDEPLPSLPIVVLNNDGGGIFHLMPYGSEVEPAMFRRIFATPHGLPLHGLALTMGHGYAHVDDPAEFVQVLQDAWSTPGITLIEIITDTPTETDRHRAITAAITLALAG